MKTRDQLLISFQHLRRSVSIENAEEKRSALHTSNLTAPLGRSLSPRERLLTVSNLFEYRHNRKAIYSPHNPNINEINAPSKIQDLGLDYFEFRGGYISRHGYLISSKRIFLDDVQWVMPSWRAGGEHDDFYNDLPLKSYDSFSETAVVDLPENKYGDDVFLFNVKNAQVNFGHFFLDFMIQLSAFRHVYAKNPKVRAYVPVTFKYSVQNYLLEKIFTESQLESMIRLPRPGRYNTVYTSSPQFPPLAEAMGLESARRCRAEMIELSRTLAAKQKIVAPEKIFVSRRDGTSNAYNRSNSDDDTLEKFFHQFGFVSIINSKMSPESQIAAYSNAKIVAGVHGAGLLNVIFSGAASPTLIEIDAEIPAWRAIERFIRGVGIKHFLVQPTRGEGALSYGEGLEQLRPHLTNI
jgi:hypothetical protein